MMNKCTSFVIPLYMNVKVSKLQTRDKKKFYILSIKKSKNKKEKESNLTGQLVVDIN